ncbi:MAG TPA: tRNA (guanosine(46)-N7)-methyltransferase TrmB [Bacteroidetes bacterium]|nr:tRNA (guanosine(46)-N7)-methyltransferase TrmB [Bacteroidota bacterium]
MAKRKLSRYQELSGLENVIELEDYHPETVSPHRGRWCESVFGNDAPLILELACGKGDYTLELAQRYPNINFVGVDIKGDRIWRGAVEALKNKLTNVRFLRIYIDHITNYFSEKEVDEIWITFPDPYLNEKKENKRLTSPMFLEKYRQILKNGGRVNLKTDSPELFFFTMEVIEDQKLIIVSKVLDVHGSKHDVPNMDILTYYEKKHLEDSRTIYFVSFKP